MPLKGSLPGVTFRRSSPSDASQLAKLMQLCDAIPEGIPTPRVFGVERATHFASLIQTAYLSVTAVRANPSPPPEGTNTPISSKNGTATDTVVGFIVLSDAPNDAPSRDGGGLVGCDRNDASSDHADLGVGAYGRHGLETRTSDLERTGVFVEDNCNVAVGATLENSLWLRMLIAPPSEAIPEVASSLRPCAASEEQTAHIPQDRPFTTAEMAMELLRVACGTLSAVEHIFILPWADFACLQALPGVRALPEGAVVPAQPTSSASALQPRILHLSRASVFPPLSIRPGRVEDYDDTVSLLIAGGRGVITELPPQFYLEEILQEQDTYNKVIVAEDAVTHEVVGVACVRQLSVEAQQHMARVYNTDAFERLKRLPRAASDSDAQAGGNLYSSTVSIFFLYFNPSFDHSAYQLLPFLFQEFPSCDYATLNLSHTLPQPHPMVLERFQYMPLRHYQPHNARGEIVPAPDALWVCPRVALETPSTAQVRVEWVTSPGNESLRDTVLAQFVPLSSTSPLTFSTRFGAPAGSGVHAVLHQQHGRGASSNGMAGLPGCSAELQAALQEDLSTSEAASSSPEEVPGADKAASGRMVFALTWGNESAASAAHAAAPTAPLENVSPSLSPLPPYAASVVGVISVQPLSVTDMYALRANYDVDRFLSFNAAGGFDYAATDIALTAEEGSLRYRSSELRGLLVRLVYIRPVFRYHLRFFLREVLRLTRAEVLLTLTTVDATLCQTAVATFTFVPPRRVVEVSTGLKENLELSSQPSTLSRILTLPEANDVTPSVTQRTPTIPGKERAAEASLALSSLFFTTRRFLGDERVQIPARIVIVGASSTALCVLYELLTVPYLDYLNITVIATDGMPVHPNQRPLRQWQVDGMELMEREYARLQLGNGLTTPQTFTIGANVIRVVQGTLIDIDTAMKFVHLENNIYEPYDQLLLATGRQYVVPPVIRTLQQQEAHGTRGGVLALSGEVAEDRLRHTLAELSQSVSGSVANVVVYGSGLDAASAVSTMILMGFPPQRLVLCRPNEKERAFVDTTCGQAATALFRALGVTVLDGYGVSRLEFDDEALASVLLASLSHERKAGDAVELPCALIVCLEEKEIDRSVLTALAKRSIVFDGRVIVGSAYETSQPHVLAAGPVAMFTRRYGATEAFETFHPRDVGRDVAHVLLGRLGIQEFQARLEPNETPQGAAPHTLANHTVSKCSTATPGSVEESVPAATSTSVLSHDSTTSAVTVGPSLPSYTSPVSRRVRFPCGYQYACTVCGAAAFEMEECVPLEFSSTDMLSVSLDDVQSSSVAAAQMEHSPFSWREMMILYVHTQHRTIDGVVYFGNGTPEVHNYRALIGLPESLFHLQYRHREVLMGSSSCTLVSTPAGSSGISSVPAGVLTAPARNKQFDIINYLRLPTVKPLLTDGFARFFSRLQGEVQKTEEAMDVRARILAAQQASGTLSPAEISAHVSELTDAKNAFLYKVQLALLKYLHESKDMRPQDLYLPSIEAQMREIEATE